LQGGFHLLLKLECLGTQSTPETHADKTENITHYF
jgi:hypothetical protein